MEVAGLEQRVQHATAVLAVLKSTPGVVVSSVSYRCVAGVVQSAKTPACGCWLTFLCLTKRPCAVPARGKPMAAPLACRPRRT